MRKNGSKTGEGVDDKGRGQKQTWCLLRANNNESKKDMIQNWGGSSVTEGLVNQAEKFWSCPVG